MITKLTKEQEDQMEVFRDISLSVGLATGPTNREVVIPLFKKLYTDYLGKKAPEIFIFVKSPLEAKKVLNVLTEDKTDKLHHKWTLETNDEFVAELLKMKSGFKNFETHGYGYGSNECYWIWYFNYMRDILGIQYGEKENAGLNLFAELAKNSGWHYLAEDCVVVCDRPIQIEMENGVLNNLEGPAVRFADGFSVYAVNGHIVTNQIIEAPETITLEQIEKENNNETKRIMIERYGVEEYFTMTAAKVLDRDCLGLNGSATRLLVEDIHHNRWLCCSDGSTGRMYYLPAGEAKTCKEAHTQMCGFDESKIIAEC